MVELTAIAAIILAGGRSTRMGSDKALLIVDGEPLLRRTCQMALLCTSEVYVVTPWVDRYQAILPFGCRLVPEVALTQTATHGPLLGFAQGLVPVQSEWVLLLACDLPCLEAAVLQRWLAQLRLAEPQEIALLPNSKQGWEPLCGFYRTSCRASLERAIAQGCRSFQRWLAGEPVRELQLEAGDRTVLFNCNTPEDLAQVQSK